MTIYLYGDSFSSPVAGSEDWAWYHQVGKQTNQQVTHHGVPGASLQYLYHCFEKTYADIEQDSTVIFCLPAMHRQWFFADKPGASSLHTAPRHGIGQDVHRLMVEFFQHLYNETNGETGLLNFLYRLNWHADTLRCQTIIVPCFEKESEFLKDRQSRFPTLSFAQGSLQSVSEAEFSPDISGNLKIHFYQKQEMRANHLCRSNHDGLAKKVIDGITTGAQIDLSTGFVSNLISAQNMSNAVFRSQELLPV
jgi:hypothetical protein